MLINIDFEKLNNEEKDVITKLISLNKANITDWQSEFITNEIKYRVDNDSSGYTEKEKEEASKSFKERLEENLDDFIDNEYLYETWQEHLGRAKN